MRLDHLLWGAPSLDDGVGLFAGLTGVTPVAGGSHPGLGTRNCLTSLGADVFFEVISPDPAQPTLGPRATAIAGLPGPGLITFAVQTDSIDEACRTAEGAGLEVAARVNMTRTRPDGVRLSWTVAQFAHPRYGAAVPFAIDWQGSPHPAATTPGGCTLRRFAVLHPDPAPLRTIFRALGVEAPVCGALRPGFVATLDTPAGDVCLLSPAGEGWDELRPR